MTYNIDFAPAISGWWIVLIIAFGVAVIIATVAIASPDYNDQERSPRRQAFGYSVLAIGLLITAAAFTVWGVIHHQQSVTRAHAVSKAWGLDSNDASYLLGHLDNPDAFFGGGGDGSYYESLVTLDGKPAKAYLLKQGNSLRLIEGGKPLPVVGR